MKESWKYIILILLGIIIIAEILQLVQISVLRKPDKEEFLPMVYENQVYQSVYLDGHEVSSSTFHEELIKRKIADQPILVFRYSGLSCKGCVRSCYNALRKQYANFEDNERILIVVSEPGADAPPANSLILITGEMLGYDYEDTHIPHFFVYDHRIMHTFVPDQMDTNAIGLYLSAIIGRYGI